MSIVVQYIADGTTFIAGSLALMVTALLGLSSRQLFRRIAVLTGLLSVIMIAISSTPLHPAFYAVWVASFVAWCVFLNRKTHTDRGKRLTAMFLAGMAGLGLLVEWPTRMRPTLPAQSSRTVVIFGDSVTAGIGENEAETWPSILQRTQDVTVHDFSRMGATLASTRKRAQSSEFPAALVVLEIGGNDILGGANSDDFARDLEALLADLSPRAAHIVMFELPLPPFCNAYGRAQRRLAPQYHVDLIPKHVFMHVLAGNDSTLDSIHLSQSGHQLMANEVWPILENAYRP